MVRGRIGGSSGFSNRRAHDALRGAARKAAASEHHANSSTARRERLSAASGYVKAVEESLFLRLKHGVPPEERTHWLECRRAADIKYNASLDGFLERGALPSLTHLGRWLKSPPKPEALGALIVNALGCPRDHYPTLFALADVRNVLSHQADYEYSELPLALAQQFVSASAMVDGMRTIDVSTDQLAELERVCSDILKRQMPPLPPRRRAP